MSVIDLNSKSVFCHPSAKPQKGMAYEHWKNCLYTSDGSFALTRISPLCRPVSRRLQDPEFLFPGSIALYGLCPTDLPGKFAGYRSLSASTVLQALSHGNPRQGLPKHDGIRQRTSGLAHLRRLRTRVVSHRQEL